MAGRGAYRIFLITNALLSYGIAVSREGRRIISMSITVTGTIERNDMGADTWALVEGWQNLRSPQKAWEMLKSGQKESKFKDRCERKISRRCHDWSCPGQILWWLVLTPTG